MSDAESNDSGRNSLEWEEKFLINSDSPLGAVRVTPYRNCFNIFAMSFAFLLVFTAFQTTQNLAVKLLGGLGAFSLSIVYGVLAFAGTFTPAVVNKLGPRAAMVLASSAYVFYLGSLIWIIPALVLIASFFLGAGAALLWTGQGAYLTQCTNETNRGLYGGIFWAIFMVALIPGNVLSHFLLSKADASVFYFSDEQTSRGWDAENSVLFCVLTFLAFLGCVFFLLLRAPDPMTGSTTKMQIDPIKETIWSTLQLATNSQLLLLSPLMVLTGVETVFWSSLMPRQMHASQIGLVMCGLGVAEILGALLLGKVSDTFGNGLVLGIGMVCCSAGLALAWLGNQILVNTCGGACLANEAHYLPFYGAAIMLGLADASFQTQTAAILSDTFVEKPAQAFALFRTHQSLAAMILFLLTPALGSGEKGSSPRQFLLEICIVVGNMALVIPCYLIFKRRKATYLTPLLGHQR